MSGTSVFAYSALKRGVSQPLSQYTGKVTVIVNTASLCSFTGMNMAQLVQLQNEYTSKNVTVLAFPCSQFANQEPKSNEEICTWAEEAFQVNFPIFDKVKVKGRDADPLFAMLQKSLGPIHWNYTKFVCDKDGLPLAKLDQTAPYNALISAVEKALR